MAAKAQMKYLSLVLDRKWNFGVHFIRPNLRGAAAALARLLPNMRGPGTASRKLYASFLRNKALQGGTAVE